jgi:hypothetical protein
MRDDEIEDGVSEKLEALVVIGTRIALFVAPRWVTECLFEERAFLEDVAEDGF